MSNARIDFACDQRVALVSQNRHYRSGQIQGFDQIQKLLKNYVLTYSGHKYCYDGHPWPFRFSNTTPCIEIATEAHDLKLKAQKFRDVLSSLSWPDTSDDFVLGLKRVFGTEVAFELKRILEAKAARGR